MDQSQSRVFQQNLPLAALRLAIANAYFQSRLIMESYKLFKFPISFYGYQTNAWFPQECRLIYL